MNKYEHVRRRMIEAAGHMTQSLGIGRVLGQIFAYLYLSSKPQTLDDIVSHLGISKGSASMGVRQLEQWDALEKLWVKGDRKDYYRARDRPGRIVKNVIFDLAGKRIEVSATALREIETELNTRQNGTRPDDEKFLRDRVEHIKMFQNKAQKMWNSAILEMLLK